MKHALACLTLLIVILGPAAARAAPSSPGLADVFIRFCGDTGGDVARAVKLADAEGWSKTAVTPPVIGLAGKAEVQSRWTPVAGGRLVFFAGTAQDHDGRAVACAVSEVASGRADFAALQQALQAWAGAPPIRADADLVVFAFRDVGGSKTPVTPSQDPLAKGAARLAPDVTVVILSRLLGRSPLITYMRRL